MREDRWISKIHTCGSQGFLISARYVPSRSVVQPRDIIMNFNWTGSPGRRPAFRMYESLATRACRSATGDGVVCRVTQRSKGYLNATFNHTPSLGEARGGVCVTVNCVDLSKSLL